MDSSWSFGVIVAVTAIWTAFGYLIGDYLFQHQAILRGSLSEERQRGKK